jgi:hypothetical protein
MIQQRPAQQVQPSKGQLGVSLHSRRTDHPVPGRPRHHVLQQRRLADPGLTTDDQGLTHTALHTLHEQVELLALGAPIDQHVPSVGAVDPAVNPLRVCRQPPSSRRRESA